MTFGEGSENVKRGGESADEFHRSHFIPEELSKLIELEGDTGLNVLAKLTNGFGTYHKNRATCDYERSALTDRISTNEVGGSTGTIELWYITSMVSTQNWSAFPSFVH